REAPAVTIIATSRHSLQLESELLFELGPIELPVEGADAADADAVRLFLDRARMVSRDFSMTPKEASAIAALVRELDGLPLAIELAAARIRLLSPTQMLEHMSRRFEILSRPTGRAHRSATLFDAIASSWGLLEPPERAALAECSVFRGGFSLQA